MRPSKRTSRSCWRQALLPSALSMAIAWLASAFLSSTCGPASRSSPTCTWATAIGAAASAKRLSEDLDHIAREGGDTEIVVSATPSQNTVRFYMGRGYQPMAEPFPELFALEPEDIHLHKKL